MKESSTISSSRHVEESHTEFTPIQRLPPPEAIVDIVMKSGAFDTLREQLLESLIQDGSITNIEKFASGLGFLFIYLKNQIIYL